MNSYNEILKALSEGETIQGLINSETSDYRDLTRKDVLIDIAEELIQPSRFRIKPKASWEEELWLQVRKDATISFSAISEFVDALKEEWQKQPDSEGWFKVPSDWNEERCPIDIAEDTRIEVEYRRTGYDTDKLCVFCVASWVQENDPWDIIRYRVI